MTNESTKINLDQWPTLSRLLDEALDLPDDAAREQWLAALAEKHKPLKPALRELLAQRPSDEREGPSSHTTQVHRCRCGTRRSPGQCQCGSHRWPYHLIRELGRGCMAVVWLAERSDGMIRRPVALKLPLVSVDNDQFVERFARERDFLARLTHPNIARLYDAGITLSGQQFLALEYVEGPPLVEYCDARALTIDARLKLFLQVLHAVHYAHTQQIVHRDLKPSNIR